MSSASRSSSRKAKFGSGLFATTEHDRDLDLVALLKKPDHVALLGLVVVRIDLRSQFHFLDDRLRLVAARFALLDCGFIFELAVVHEFRDRWLTVRSNLDEVKVCVSCEPQRLVDADDTDLFAVGSDQTDFRYTDPLVDAGFDADGASLLSGGQLQRRSQSWAGYCPTRIPGNLKGRQVGANSASGSDGG